MSDVADNEGRKETFSFTVHLDTRRYLAVFGVDLPDDSMDSGLTGNAKRDETPSDPSRMPQNREEGRGTADEPSGTADASTGVLEGSAQKAEMEAEDASVGVHARVDRKLGSRCKATLQQCQAKNPLTCRYHGALLIAQEIESLVRAQGVGGNVRVELTDVTQEGSKQLLSASVEIDGTSRDKAGVVKAMRSFATRLGVDYVEAPAMDGKKLIFTGFDIDILDPAAQARWGASVAASAPQPAPQPKPQSQPKPANAAPQPQTAQVPPQSAAASEEPPAAPKNRLRPPIRPIEPPPWNGLSEADCAYLEAIGMDLAFLVQRVNRNIEKGSPGGGTKAAANFGMIDATRLADLAKRDETGQAKRINDIYLLAKKSEANGWKDEIQIPGVPYDPTKYNSADPVGSTGYASWKFDSSKVAKDPHAAARKAYAQWVSPADKRADAVSAAKSALSSTEDGAPHREAKSLLDAHKGMEGIEKYIATLDAAISAETDREKKKALENILAKAEGYYFAANEAFAKAEKSLAKWISSHQMMGETDTCADIAKKLSAQGRYVAPLLLTADAAMKACAQAAETRWASKFASIPGGKKAAEQNFRNNLRAMWESDDVEVLVNCNATTAVFVTRDQKPGTRSGRYEAGGVDGDYRQIGRTHFGANYRTARETHKYGAFFPKGSEGHTGYGETCLVFDKKKIVGFLSGPHSYTRGTSNLNPAMNPVLPQNATLTGYWDSDLISKDMSKEPNAGKKILDRFKKGPDGHGCTPEFWFAGDVTPDMLERIRFASMSDANTLLKDSECVKNLKKYGVKIEVDGKEIEY